jgi:hypothetical protein
MTLPGRPLWHARVLLPAWLAALAGLAACASLKADGGQVQLNDLPTPVYNTMNRAIPGATFSTAVKGQEYSQEVYVITGKAANGRKVRLVVGAAGTALAVNTDVDPKEVPEDVTKTLDHWMKGFQTSAAMRSVRQAGTSIWYEFEGKEANGQKARVEIRADGKKILIEEP